MTPLRLTERGTAARQAFSATSRPSCSSASLHRRAARRRGKSCRTTWRRGCAGRCADEEAGVEPVPDRRSVLSQARTPVEQMLRLIVPGFVGTTRHVVVAPLSNAAPGFWEYLEVERGLKTGHATRVYSPPTMFRALSATRRRHGSLTAHAGDLPSVYCAARPDPSAAGSATGRWRDPGAAAVLASPANPRDGSQRSD